MERLYCAVVAAGPLGMLAAGLLPSAWANRHASVMRRVVRGVAAWTLAWAAAATAMLAVNGPLHASPIPATAAENATALGRWIDRVCVDGLYFDSLSSVMLLLVSFLGLIVVRYSDRYLDGDPAQGRFFRWIAFTLGGVLWLIVAGNLLLFVGAWIATSFGLHQLLTHYSDRPAALLAARKKFLISRLGDLFLAAALVLTYRTFGTFDFGELFAAARALQADAVAPTWTLSWIGTLFVLGAMTKSAQFPLHTWLPDTMETPTPVSALMHAGIINAGGFLVIRLSPIISTAHLPLDLLAIVGAITALFGALCMLAQTSVKRGLAYSTIAQMGFMMLQCGLGAFSAALLHIVAHSLYKAHAFLRSGSVLENAARLRMPSPAAPTSRQALLLLAPALLVGALVCGGALWGSGVMHVAKPGAVLLTVVMTLALTYLLWKSSAAGRWPVALAGLVNAAVLCVSYGVAYSVMDRVLATSVSRGVAPQTLFDVGLMTIAALGFAALFALQIVLSCGGRHRWLDGLYVAAANGFHLDIAAHKLTVRLCSPWQSTRLAPVPASTFPSHTAQAESAR